MPDEAEISDRDQKVPDEGLVPTRGQIDRAVQELDSLCNEEYGIDLVALLNDQDTEMAAQRMRRLTGIILKRRFAEPHLIDGSDSTKFSSTGAHRYWVWHEVGEFAADGETAPDEFAVLDGLRRALPEIGFGGDASWDYLVGMADHESGLFVILATWAKKRIEGRETRPLAQALAEPVDRRFQKLTEVTDIVANFAMTPLFASAVPLEGLIVPFSILGLKYGYGALFGQQGEPDGSG